MNRTERILLLLAEDMTPEDAFGRGITAQDTFDALTLMRIGVDLHHLWHELSS